MPVRSSKPTPTPSGLRDRALVLLCQALGDPAADFRDGQWEAIAALVERRARLLVVQRTGWGKSAVYFLSTRLLREQGGGPALLVSPLLALMRNQIECAARLGIRAATVNSTNRDDWKTVEGQLAADEIDLLLVSPERLAGDEVLNRRLLPQADRLSMLIIDEAHCISDWGHDFRPDYRRIRQLLDRLPSGTPICTTTATANDRVIDDVQRQLGGSLDVIRGPLARTSLRLQTVTLLDDVEKLAWLAHWLPKLKGHGIVYALTVRWADRIAAWLQHVGINALAYHADLDDETRQTRERQLLANEVKALVATTALGMGFDKPDLGFVVHFHQPGSVVAYYQQVGRAGRALTDAYGVMLCAKDDALINDWFIANAFPGEADIAAILDALEQAGQTGMKLGELEKQVNVARPRIEQVLKTLAVESPSPVAFQEGIWRATTAKADAARRRSLVERVTALRRGEQAQMDAYREHAGCLMKFLTRALDDPNAITCGKCAVCQGRPEAMRGDEFTARILEANAFLDRSLVPIEPRAQWPAGAIAGRKGRIPQELRMEEGRAMCVATDPRQGSAVRTAREQGRFSDAFVEEMLELLEQWQPAIARVVCVPSLTRPALVSDFARRLAKRLGLPFADIVTKVRDNRPQKEMANSWQRAHNLDGVFRVEPGRHGDAGGVLLVDDLADSRWTLTVVALLLREAGCPAVFPVVLSSGY